MHRLLFPLVLDALLSIGPLAAQQQPAAPSGPLTLLQAISLGRQQGVDAAVARLALSANETIRAREADSTVAAQLLSQARQLVSAGVSPAIDATRSEVSFASVRTQLTVARNAADRAHLDLLRTLDLPSGTRLQLADSLGLGALDLPLSPDTAAAFAREHRAELAAERNRTKA